MNKKFKSSQLVHGPTQGPPPPFVPFFCSPGMPRPPVILVFTKVMVVVAGGRSGTGEDGRQISISKQAAVSIFFLLMEIKIRVGLL